MLRVASVEQNAAGEAAIMFRCEKISETESLNLKRCGITKSDHSRFEAQSATEALQ
jgi:hypothetical protein